jgi:hypothetical protein
MYGKPSVGRMQEIQTPSLCIGSLLSVAALYSSRFLLVKGISQVRCPPRRVPRFDSRAIHFIDLETKVNKGPSATVTVLTSSKLRPLVSGMNR